MPDPGDNAVKALSDPMGTHHGTDAIKEEAAAAAGSATTEENQPKKTHPRDLHRGRDSSKEGAAITEHDTEPKQRHSRFEAWAAKHCDGGTAKELAEMILSYEPIKTYMDWGEDSLKEEAAITEHDTKPKQRHPSVNYEGINEEIKQVMERILKEAHWRNMNRGMDFFKEAPAITENDTEPKQRHLSVNYGETEAKYYGDERTKQLSEMIEHDAFAVADKMMEKDLDESVPLVQGVVVSVSDPKAIDSMHDYLSVGEIEPGLRKRKMYSLNEGEDRIDADSFSQRRSNLDPDSIEEIRRLPYFLRILSSTRPLASVQTFVAPGKGGKDLEPLEPEKEPEREPTNARADQDIDRLVDRLEDVAATHSVAGGIDVLANHLVPSVSKTLSRLPPLSKTHDYHEGTDPTVRNDWGWNTEELAAVARDPIAKRKRTTGKDQSKNRKKKLETDAAEAAAASTDADDALGTSSDEENEDGGITLAAEQSTDRHGSLKRRDSMVVAAEDSQESTVIKTVSELASLVVLSLQDPDTREAEGEADEDPEHRSSGTTRKASSVLSLNTDDILSEKAASSGARGGVAQEGSDLSSTIVAIMHNAPVLRSRHVASALCRASVPQADALISRLGANCPASVPSLLLGCIEAYSMSVESQDNDDGDGIGSSNNNNNNNSSSSNKNSNAGASPANASCTVVATSKSAVEALAGLSLSESSRVRTKLQSLGVMLDVQLKLSIKAAEVSSNKVSELVSVACLILQHLSFPSDRTRAARNDPATPSEGGPLWGDNAESNYARIESYARACSKVAEPSLLLHFVRKPELYDQTLEFFLQTLDRDVLGSGAQSHGRSCLVLKALLLLLLVPLTNSSMDFSSVWRALKSLGRLVRALYHAKKSVTPKKSNDLIGLVSSCAILLCSRFVAIHDDDEGTEKELITAIYAFISMMSTMTASTTDQYNLILESVRSELETGDLRVLFQRIVYPIDSTLHIEGTYAEISYAFVRPGLNRLCKTTKQRLPQTTDEKKRHSAFDIFSLLNALERGSNCVDDNLVEKTKRILGWLLKEATEDDVLSLMENTETVEFIIKATRFLLKPGSLEVLIVLPTNLDMTWSTIVSKQPTSNPKKMAGRKCKYLLQFLYALIVLDVSPRSPFAFDPRSTHIKETLLLIENLPSKATRDCLLSEVRNLLEKHCPEFSVDRFKRHLDFRVSPPFDDMDCKSLLVALCSCIRAALHQDDTHNCKNTIELLYLQAKAQVCDSDVYCAVTNALLSSPHSPLPTYTYHLLCRDPIICLKFPLSVWKCRSLRRIGLSVLENLLLSNNAIVLEESRNDDAALEFLVARDAIIVRCLLAILHEGDSNSLIICPMTTSIIRWLIQSRPGLVALLVKQGLREQDVDWLVENVPETMNDSESLLQILSERNSLTAAERLVAADTIIRIAIVHGRANDADASQLILTAFSQMVDSFYLILGPVGLLPVDALFNAESSTPITQISQKAAFRILKSLTRLRGVQNPTRSECSVILKKLIHLCKAELQGAVTGRRKQLIKELYDAAVKADK